MPTVTKYCLISLANFEIPLRPVSTVYILPYRNPKKKTFFYEIFVYIKKIYNPTHSWNAIISFIWNKRKIINQRIYELAFCMVCMRWPVVDKMKITTIIIYAIFFFFYHRSVYWLVLWVNKCHAPRLICIFHGIEFYALDVWSLSSAFQLRLSLFRWMSSNLLCDKIKLVTSLTQTLTITRIQYY